MRLNPRRWRASVGDVDRATAWTLSARAAAWCAATAATAAFAHLLDVTGGVFLVGLLAVLLTAIRSLMDDRPGRWVAWRSACITAACLWGATATTRGLLDGDVATYGAVGAGIVIVLTPLFWAAPPPPPEPPDPVDEVLSGRAKEWYDHILILTKARVAAIAIRDWDNGHGYDVIGEFGTDGATWEDLATKQHRFASRLRLPAGCAVEVQMHTHQGSFIARVNTRNALADIRMFNPATLTPGSIHDPRPCGPYADGTIAHVPDLREESELLVGAIGTGKSNAARGLVLWHCTRRDEVTYVIDLDGGRLGKSFVKPYLDGEIDRPILDGLAGTPEQAHALLTWLADVALDRPYTYEQLMDDHDDDKLPVSAQVPAVRVVVDEPKKIWSDVNLRHLAQQIIGGQETNRSMAIKFDFTALGGTIAAVPPDLKKQIRHRTAFRMAETAELAYALEWSTARKINEAALEPKGMAYVRNLEGIGSAPRLLRYPRYLPSHITEIAGSPYWAHVRPDIDDAAKALPSYQAVADRWEWPRTARRRTRAKESPVTTEPVKPAAADDVDPLVAHNAAMGHLADLSDQMDAILAERGLVPSTPAAEPEPPTFADIVRDFVTEAGTVVETKEIVAHLKTEHGMGQADNTLRERIGALADAGVIVREYQGHYRAATVKA